MANLSFKQGNLSNISNINTSNGAVYFSKDDTSGHSAHGYISYDDEIDRIPINGAGYYMAPDRKEPSKKNMFIEDNLFNSGAGAFIGVGHDNKDLWLHKSSTPENPDRGLWSPLWRGSEEEPTDSGTWILRVGKDPDNSTDSAEYLYLGSPKYINENDVESNIYTIRPAAKNSYLLGDTEYKWADIHTLNITSNTGIFNSLLIADGGIAGDLTGNATTATKLKTARTFQIESGNVVSFDGSANVTIPLAVSTSWDNGQTEGPKLTVTVNGVTSTETSKIPTATTNRSGVIDTTDQSFSGLKTFSGGLAGNLTGNASTATKLKTARTLKVGSGNTVSFDGSANVEIPLAVSTSWDNGQTEGPKLTVTVNGVTSAISKIPTATTGRSGVIDTTDQSFSGLKTFSGGLAGNLTGDVTGNASTATKLKTARTLKVGEGDTVSFNGSANITIPLAVSTSWSGGQTAGPKLKVTVNGTDSSETTVPIATSSASGVITTGSQTFTGAKSFTSATTFKDMVWIKDPNDTKRTGHLAIDIAKDVAGKDRRTLCMGISYDNDTKSYSRLLLVSGPDSTLSPLYISSDYKEVPSYISLGTSSRPWVQLFATDDSINASDIRLKEVQDETYLQRLLQVYDQVSPIAYKRKNLSEYDDYKRIHIGLSAQEVEEKMIANNLTNLDFGGLCIDSVDPDIEVYKKVLLDGKKYSLRYGEFHGLHILKNHQQDARLTELENKNKELENTIATLKTQIELLKLAVGG